MAYWAWKDISAVTYNSQDLKGFVAGGFNVSGHAVLDDFKPAGSAWPTPLDTGGRSVDPITIPFKYDGSATGPCVKAALGTSATMTLTHATGQSVSGTFIVSDFDDQRDAALARLKGWVDSGALKVREDVLDGLERLPSALVGLLAGENIGKRMVRIA